MGFVSLLRKIKEPTFELNYGRDIFMQVSLDYIQNKCGDRKINILDLGCGNGKDLANIKERTNAMNAVEVDLYGIEGYPPNVEKCKQNGIYVFNRDIERDILPFKDHFFDILIMNQVLEHTKEIFWIFGEISRVLSPGGLCIIGVPNIASMHNRIGLLFGMHPTSIELLGAHVRGITKPAFKRFVEEGKYFKLLTTKGANYYPFPPSVSKILSRVFPLSSVSIIFVCERTDKKGSFIDIMNNHFFDTKYFTGKEDA